MELYGTMVVNQTVNFEKRMVKLPWPLVWSEWTVTEAMDDGVSDEIVNLTNEGNVAEYPPIFSSEIKWHHKLNPSMVE